MKIDPFPGVLTAQMVGRPFTTKLGKWDEPRRIPNDVWRDYLTDLYAMLIKDLKLEFE